MDYQKNIPGSEGMGKTTNLSYSTIFQKIQKVEKTPDTAAPTSSILHLKTTSKDLRCLLFQMLKQQHRTTRNMKNKGNMISKRSNSPTNELKCTEFYNLADKGFKVVLLKNSMSYKKTQKDNSIKSEKNEQNETSVKRKKS